MDKVGTVVGLMKDRVSFIKDLWDVANSSSSLLRKYDEKTRKNVGRRLSPEHYAGVGGRMEALDDLAGEPGGCGHEMDKEDKGYHLGNIMNTFRLTLVGGR